MERKIGEIFEFGGEWYQIVEASFDEHSCNGCQGCKGTGGPRIFGGECNGNARKDGKFVIFKKLEKVGEPIEFTRGSYFQRYQLADSTTFYEGDTRLFFNAPTKTLVYIEIKNKEDMEEKKLNLKPFDLKAAKSGKPVCTRDGRKARIICFDRVGDFPIVALTDDRDYKEEGVNLYDINGKGSNECFDLMMLPEKKEGWINIKKDTSLFKSREEAERNCIKDYAPVRVEFEI